MRGAADQVTSAHGLPPQGYGVEFKNIKVYLVLFL
jgi:hypothetical protein